MPTKLSPTEREQALRGLPNWSYADERGGVMRRTFEFSDFAQAFAFMARVAVRAEEVGHHPEWCNIYNRVDVVLTTHDVDGLSALDLDMAAFMQEAWQLASAQPEHGETQ